MNKAVPWNINGVGFDAREAAREAARRQGKSLGEWLHGVIADHASDLGVEEDAFGGQDRIDAVTAKLERLSAPTNAEKRGEHARGRSEPNRDGTIRGRLEAVRDADDEHGFDAALAPRFRRSDSARDGEHIRDERRPFHAKTIAEETELLLDEAIEAMERRTLRAERKTDKAIASVAKVIESAETKRDDEREMFVTLTRKIADMETRIASRVSDDNYGPIKGALARLEARLETLGRRPLIDPQGGVFPPPLAIVPPFAAAAQPAAARQPALQPASRVDHEEEAGRRARDRVRDDEIRRLETKLNSILDAVTTRPAPTNVPSSNQPPSSVQAPYLLQASPNAAYREPKNDQAKRRLGEAIADIADRQRALEANGSGRLAIFGTRASLEERATAGRMPQAPSRFIEGLQNDIAGLASKIDDMRRDIVPPPASKAKDPATAQIEGLRAEIAEMAEMIKGRAPRATTAVESRHHALNDGTDRRDDAKPTEVASRTDLEGLKAEIAGISGTLSELAPRGTVTGLEEAIRTLTDRIEASRDGLDMRPLDAIVGDLRHSITDMGTRDTIGILEREVRTIGDKLDGLNGVDVAALGRLQDQTEEIRRLLTVAAASPLAVERIERQVATLAEKMDRQPRFSSQDDQALRKATTEIRAMLENPPGAALFDKIERRLEALTAKVDQAVEEAVGARKVAEQSRRHFDSVQDDLVARLGVAPQVSTDMLSLESLVRDLSDRIEAVRAPDASHQAIEALQEQIVRLSNRFERTDGELSALSGIERSMRDLFAQLEETRATVETSAVKAARQAMDTALHHGGLADPTAARDIATLKAIQQEADHRTHATLNAVHEALEKVVDRLSSMENDIANVRAPAQQTSDEAHRESTTSSRRGPSVRSARPSTLPDLMLGESDMSDVSRARSTRARDETKRRAGDQDPARGDDASALDHALKASDRRSPSFGGTRASDRDGDAGHSDFIAAARRAARAVQNDPAVVALKRVDTPAASDLRAGLMAQTRDYVASHKKPVLLSVAALFVTLGTLAVMGSIKDGDTGQMAMNTPPSLPLTMAAAQPRRAEPSRVQPSRIEPSAPSAGRATLADLTPSALPKAPAPVTDPLPGSDPITTGSIARLPSFAAQAVGGAPIAPAGALKQLADAGNIAAQYEVASRYAEGRQLVKDYSLAAAWFEKAAQQGAAPAQYKLAALYEKGLGVQKDKARARFWYQKAADSGNPRAMHNLAVLSADGDGKPDYANAVLWFRRAAEYGVHDSQYNLAILLARGLGTPQSLVQSYQWFAVAAQQNDVDAATKREEVASKLAPNDLSVARALAGAFHAKTADVAAVEIDPPAGGWDGALAPSLVRSTRPKLSSL